MAAPRERCGGGTAPPARRIRCCQSDDMLPGCCNVHLSASECNTPPDVSVFGAPTVSWGQCWDSSDLGK